MDDWIRDLHEKAGKAMEFYARGFAPGDPVEEYIDACDPARIRVLCEAADELERQREVEMGLMAAVNRHGWSYGGTETVIALLKSLEPK